MKTLSSSQVHSLLAFASNPAVRPDEGSARAYPGAIVLPGTVIGERFVVLEALGAGGMGVVYKALDRTSNCTVALKLRVQSSPSERARFEREADLLSRQLHPRLVRYIDHGAMPNGVLFIAMELLRGVTLAERLYGWTPTVREAVTIAVHIAEALDALHEGGIVHRDLKPENVLLEAGTIEGLRLIDLGIARPSDLEALTHGRVLMGTPEYMAPEQVRDARDVDGRCDLFALGCLLYEMLTGTPPFLDDGTDSFYQRLLLEPTRPISELRPDLPQGLADLIMQLLVKDRDQRPATARAVVEALQAILGSAPKHLALGRVIGRGTVFDVFEAGGAHPDIALKRMKLSSYLDTEVRSVAAIEARRLIGFSHPSIAAPVDVLELDEELVLVVRRLEGPSLAELLGTLDTSSLQLDLAYLARIALDLSSGLTALHAAGFTHGDVDMRSVLFASSGEAVLLEPMPVTAARTRSLRNHGLAFPPPEAAASPGMPAMRPGDIFAAAETIRLVLSFADQGSWGASLQAALGAIHGALGRAAAIHPAQRAGSLGEVTKLLAALPLAPHSAVRQLLDRPAQPYDQ